MVKSSRVVLKLVIVGIAVAVAAWLILTKPFILPQHTADTDYVMHIAAPQRCVGVFIICMSLWFTNLIPLAATGLLAIALLPLLGILPEQRAFGLFGNEAVFFMLGVFLLAAAMIVTGLSKRLTLLALHRFDKTPSRLVLGVTVSASFLALWMPEHAVAAMIYPIIVEITEALKLPKGSNYAKKLFLGLAWGSIIGGVGTFLGGARAPLALGLLKQAHPDHSISFLGWMLAAAPIVLIMTVVAVWMLGKRIPNDIDDIKAATQMLDRRVRRLGPMSPRERRLAALGIVTIVLWITVGSHIGLAVIAMLSAVALFALRIVDWASVQDYVNWGVLVMYGGAVALGAALTETQAIDWMARQFIDPGTPAILVTLLLAVSAMVLTEGISNSATVAILLPIGYSLGSLTGVGPIMVTLVVTIPAGLAFLLPISSPPNAICFSSGHYGIREVVQLGWPMNVISVTVVVVVILVWWGPVLGVNSW